MSQRRPIFRPLLLALALLPIALLPALAGSAHAGKVAQNDRPSESTPDAGRAAPSKSAAPADDEGSAEQRTAPPVPAPAVDLAKLRAEIRLDGNSIWDSGEKPLVDELIKVSERPAKPGPHTLTVRIEVRPGKKGEKEHADLGYESEQTFVVNVPEGRRTAVEITADDDGDLPGYEPEIALELKTEK